MSGIVLNLNTSEYMYRIRLNLTDSSTIKQVPDHVTVTACHGNIFKVTTKALIVVLNRILCQFALHVAVVS